MTLEDRDVPARPLSIFAAIATTLAAFARTRWLARRLKTRADIEAWQAHRLKQWLARDVLHVPAYAGLRATTLEDLPEIDKAALMADFAAYNRAGITAAEVRAALDRGEERVRGYPIGQSTGTSGNRGLYVIGEAERFVWLGTILAKTLPDILWRRHRVALALPGFSTLYRSAERGRRVVLRFFDLAAGVDAWADDFAAFAPDTIVAPPKVLRRLAETGRLGARHIFSGAEVLDPLDRAVIEAATGARVREIYMATEGLFGVACPHGTLHLAEDVVKFEWREGGGGLVTPLVSDFTRGVQIMARYRMNDLLALSDTPCVCGSPLQAVARIEGRVDDVFELGGRMVTPDVLRNAVVDADRRIVDYRVVQAGAREVTVWLDPALPREVEEAVAGSLAALFARMGVVAAVRFERGLPVAYDRKLRRVRREWRGN